LEKRPLPTEIAFCFPIFMMHPKNSEVKKNAGLVAEQAQE